MARAAERCFVSERSCSSVRSSSCWIAPRVPTWYCIFVCRCLATAVSVRASPLPLLLVVGRPVQPERALRDALQPVPELDRSGGVHADAPLEVRDDPLPALRDLHLQDGIAMLAGVLEPRRADPK